MSLSCYLYTNSQCRAVSQPLCFLILSVRIFDLVCKYNIILQNNKYNKKNLKKLILEVLKLIGVSDKKLLMNLFSK